MPFYRSHAFELEEQAAEQWFRDSGELKRLNEQYQAIRRSTWPYSEPSRVVAPNTRAYQLCEKLFGVPVEIREDVTVAYIE